MQAYQDFTKSPLNITDEILGGRLCQGLGDSTALLCDNQSLSYHQLNALTNRYGNAFKAHGVGPGDRVLLVLDDSPDMVAAYLAAMRIGAVAVALNVRAAPKDLLYVIRDTECRALLIEDQFLSLYQAIAEQIELDPTLVVMGEAPSGYRDLQSFLSGHSDTLPTATTAPEDMAYWIYSSGTTGTPKAAVHRHRDIQIAHRHLSDHLGVGPGSRVFTTSKLFFAFALGHSLLGTLRCGATVILHRGWPEAADIAATVAQYHPDVVLSVPTMYRNLLRTEVARQPAFAGVRHYVSAGEKLPESLLQQWQEATGQPILEGIGTSETVFLFIANTPQAVRPGSCGRQVPWAEVQLMDEEGVAITEPNTVGVLWVRMPSVFACYWNQPNQTEHALSGAWYCTGDMFSCDSEGWWYHHGRADDMLKISGQWVSPAEIEECALGVPGVQEAAVVGIENADGLIRAALFVVPDTDSDSLVDAVGERLQRHLSIYKCPRVVRCIEEVPRTATGKVQRYKLRELLAKEDALEAHQ